jgi:glutathione S-transferase
MAAAGAGGGAGDQLTVLGAWASPFLVRVRLALHLKALEYEYVEVDLKDKSDLLLASNPVHKKVPVLLHGGKPVCESMLIVQYLDDAFPGYGPAFLPADPHDRAVARFWAAYVDDKVRVLCFTSISQIRSSRKESHRSSSRACMLNC